MVTPDPLVNFFFDVRIDQTDYRDAAFAEASGLDAELGTETIEEGGENRFSHRVPTRATHGNLVLKRGLLREQAALFTWCKTTMENGLAQPLVPRTITVSLLDATDNDPLLTWNFVRCWPVKMQMSPLDARQGEVLVETLEFAYTYMTRAYTG